MGLKKYVQGTGLNNGLGFKHLLGVEVAGAILGFQVSDLDIGRLPNHSILDRDIEPAMWQMFKILWDLKEVPAEHSKTSSGIYQGIV